MSYSFKLRKEASRQFSDAFVWYEKQLEGLGDIFSINFHHKLNKICSNPYLCKTSYKGFHEALTDKFPFLIVYTIDDEIKQITVISIFHTSRNPKKKYKK